MNMYLAAVKKANFIIRAGTENMTVNLTLPPYQSVVCLQFWSPNLKMEMVDLEKEQEIRGPENLP